MTHQIKGFGDDEVFIIINGILYKKNDKFIFSRSTWIKKLKGRSQICLRSDGSGRKAESERTSSSGLSSRVVESESKYGLISFLELRSPDLAFHSFEEEIGSS